MDKIKYFQKTIEGITHRQVKYFTDKLEMDDSCNHYDVIKTGDNEYNIVAEMIMESDD